MDTSLWLWVAIAIGLFFVRLNTLKAKKKLEKKIQKKNTDENLH